MSTKVARTHGRTCYGGLYSVIVRETSAACPAPRRFIAFCGWSVIADSVSIRSFDCALYARASSARARKAPNPPIRIRKPAERSIESYRPGSRSCDVANLGSSATILGVAAMVSTGSVTEKRIVVAHR